MAGVVHIPWYATLFRGDRFAEAVSEIAQVSLRYGATEYSVYRSRDDAYKVLQFATFEHKGDFDAYWYGPDFTTWRADHTGWFQVPIVYGWHDRIAHGGIATETVSPARAAPS